MFDTTRGRVSMGISVATVVFLLHGFTVFKNLNPNTLKLPIAQQRRVNRISVPDRSTVEARTEKRTETRTNEAAPKHGRSRTETVSETVSKP